MPKAMLVNRTADLTLWKGWVIANELLVFRNLGLIISKSVGIGPAGSILSLQNWNVL